MKNDANLESPSIHNQSGKERKEKKNQFALLFQILFKVCLSSDLYLPRKPQIIYGKLLRSYIPSKFNKPQQFALMLTSILRWPIKQVNSPNLQITCKQGQK